MNDDSSEKKWEVTLGPEPLVHVHYATASPALISDGVEESAGMSKRPTPSTQRRQEC